MTFILTLFCFLSTVSIYSIDLSKPLSLTDSLELARKNNPFYIAEQQNIAIANADVTTSKLLPNPLLNNQELIRQSPASGALPYLPASGGRGGAWNDANRQDWIQLTQKIPVAGQRKYSIELALKNLQFSQKNLVEFERNLLYIVANKWIDVWFANQRLNIIKRTKEYSDDLLKINEIRLRNQVITQSEYLRTQNIVEQYEANLASAEMALKKESRNLQFLSGVNTEILINVEDNKISYEKLDESKESLIQYALGNRADIVANKVRQEVHRVNINLQEAYVYPQPEVGVIYNPQNGSPYLGTYVTVPLPVFNRNQGEIQKSHSQLKQVMNLQEALEKQLDTDVQNAIGEYNLSKANYERYKKILETTEKVLNTVRYSYLKGGTTVIDYKDAQRSWFDAQNSFYESIFNLRKSYIQVQYVTGKIQNF